MKNLRNQVKENMSKIGDEVKERVTEMKINYNEKMGDIQDFVSEKKSVQHLKHQMKRGVREEGKLARKLYHEAMDVEKNIVNDLKGEMKNEFKG